MLATIQAEAATLFQCEHCFRYFDSQGNACQRMPGLLPDVFTCGLADCAAFAAGFKAQVACVDRDAQRTAAAQRERIRQARLERRNGRKAKRRAVTSDGRRVTGEPPAADWSSCPADTEPLECGTRNAERGVAEESETRNSKLETGQVVGSSQRDFHAAVDVAPAHRKLLNYFQAHFGEYVPLTALEEICGHHAVNSRCSELRELIPADHDIDQKNILWEETGKLHSHYRLCLKSESHRLLNAERGVRNAEQEGLL